MHAIFSHACLLSLAGSAGSVEGRKLLCTFNSPIKFNFEWIVSALERLRSLSTSMISWIKQENYEKFLFIERSSLGMLFDPVYEAKAAIINKMKNLCSAFWPPFGRPHKLCFDTFFFCPLRLDIKNGYVMHSEKATVRNPFRANVEISKRSTRSSCYSCFDGFICYVIFVKFI